MNRLSIKVDKMSGRSKTGWYKHKGIKIHLRTIAEHFPDENAFISSIHSTPCASSYYRQIIWIVWLFWLIEIRLLPWIEPIILIDFLFTVFICPEAFILNDVETGISMNLIHDKRWLGCWVTRKCPSPN